MAQTIAMIQDKYMPAYHYNEVHSIRIDSSVARVRSLVNNLDFSRSRLIRFLFALRGMPASMMNMKGLERGRFVRLEVTDDEMIIGLIGQFWKPSGNMQVFRPEEFISFNEHGFLKAVWSFRLEEEGKACILETETRIQCLGESARRKFSTYWFIVKPFSGLIRMELLRTVRKEAENAKN